MSRENMDESIIQNHIQYSQNTHKTVVSSSVGTALKMLSEIYIDFSYDACIQQITSEASAYDADSACVYLTTIADEPLDDEMDVITLFIPDDNYDITQSGQDLRYEFPLKKVISLVWLALVDDEKYSGFINETTEEGRQKAQQADRYNRLFSFFNCLKMLEADPVCHQGTRHELTFVLNKSYPGIDIIEDEKATILAFLRENVTKELFILYQKTPTDQRHESMKTICSWMKTDDVTSINLFINIDKQFKQPLVTLFLKHGVNPQTLEMDVFIGQALGNMRFSCEPSTYPGLYYCASIFQTLQPKTNQPLLTDALTIVQEWIPQQMQLDDQTHIQWLETFVLIYEICQAASQYDWLFDSSDVSNLIHSIENNYLQHLVQQQQFPQDFLSSDNIEKITALQQTIEQAKQTNQIDQIESFFDRWFVAFSEKQDKKNYNQLYHQYVLLSNRTFQQQVILSDKEIERFYLREMNAYVINRVLLHAILTRPQNWSIGFGGNLSAELDAPADSLFNNVLNFIITMPNTPYPAKLIDQLLYLQEIYCESQLPSREYRILEHPKKRITTTEGMRSINDWHFIAKILVKSGHDDLFEKTYQRQQVYIDSILLKYLREHVDTYQEKNALYLAISLVAQKNKPTFLTVLHNANLTNKHRALLYMLGTTPEKDEPVFIDTLKNNVFYNQFKTQIITSHKLLKFLDSVSRKNHLPFITWLGHELQNIVFDEEEDLFSYLNNLHPDAKIPFMQFLGNTIKKSFTEDQTFNNCFANLTVDQRPQFVKLVQNNIEEIIDYNLHSMKMPAKNRNQIQQLFSTDTLSLDNNIDILRALLTLSRSTNSAIIFFAQILTKVDIKKQGLFFDVGLYIIIKNWQDLALFINELGASFVSKKEVTLICEILHNELDSFFNNTMDVIYFILKCTALQFLKPLKPYFIKFIPTLKHLKNAISSPLSKAQLISKLLDDHLVALIKNKKDLLFLLKNIYQTDTDQEALIFSAIHKIPLLINDFDALCDLIDHIKCPELTEKIIVILYANLRSLIKNAKDFSTL